MGRRDEQTTRTALDQLGRRWAAAERDGDVGTLRILLTDDFEAIGPLGYVLDRGQWLERHLGGDLSYHVFSWSASPARLYGHTAVVIGLQEASATFDGSEIAGRYRATLVAVSAGESWTIANLQLTELPEGV